MDLKAANVVLDWAGPDSRCAAVAQWEPAVDLRAIVQRAWLTASPRGLWCAFLRSSLPTALVTDFGCSVQVCVAEAVLAVYASLVFVEV
jgi:hypothetical protein